MSFLTPIIKGINNFFNNYNYNTLWWYLTDNYLPPVLTSFINNYVLNYFSWAIEEITIFFISINLFFYNLLATNKVLLNLGFTTNMVDALFISFKFLLCIALLIFARGGIPRFRFDYLTKLGWIRFLSLVLLSLLIELILLSMF